MILLKNNQVELFLEHIYVDNKIQYFLFYNKISEGIHEKDLLLENNYLVYRFIYSLRILINNMLYDNINSSKYNINGIHMELKLDGEVIKISKPYVRDIFNRPIFYGIMKKENIIEYIEILDDLEKKILNNEFIV